MGVNQGIPHDWSARQSPVGGELTSGRIPATIPAERTNHGEWGIDRAVSPFDTGSLCEGDEE